MASGGLKQIKRTPSMGSLVIPEDGVMSASSPCLLLRLVGHCSPMCSVVTLSSLSSGSLLAICAAFPTCLVGHLGTIPLFAFTLLSGSLWPYVQCIIVCLVDHSDLMCNVVAIPVFLNLTSNAYKHACSFLCSLQTNNDKNIYSTQNLLWIFTFTLSPHLILIHVLFSGPGQVSQHRDSVWGAADVAPAEGSLL